MFSVKMTFGLSHIYTFLAHNIDFWYFSLILPVAKTSSMKITPYSPWKTCTLVLCHNDDVVDMLNGSLM